MRSVTGIIKRILTTAAFVSSVIAAHSQRQSVTDRLGKADSVFLISHRSVPGSSISIVDSTGKEISFPLFLNGQLNPGAVLEKILLNTAETKKLTNMLGYKRDNILEHGLCFDPHHAVILFKAGSLSFIDLCFACRSFRTSEDIKLEDIEQKTWEGLYSFFKAKGLSYELHVE